MNWICSKRTLAKNSQWTSAYCCQHHWWKCVCFDSRSQRDSESHHINSIATFFVHLLYKPHAKSGWFITIRKTYFYGILPFTDLHPMCKNLGCLPVKTSSISTAVYLLWICKPHAKISVVYKQKRAVYLHGCLPVMELLATWQNQYCLPVKTYKISPWWFMIYGVACHR